MLIGICGRRLQGKTTLAAAIADQSEARLWLDPRGLVRRPGSVVVTSTGKPLVTAVDALADGDTDEVVFTPRGDHDLAFDAFGDELYRWCVNYPTYPLAAVVDEAKWYGDISTRRPFMNAVKTCDPDRVDIIITAHRPIDIPPDVRALLNVWIIFRTVHPADLKAIQEHCSPQVTAIARELGEREYVKWDNDHGISAVSRAPYIWYTNLSPAPSELHV